MKQHKRSIRDFKEEPKRREKIGERSPHRAYARSRIKSIMDSIRNPVKKTIEQFSEEELIVECVRRGLLTKGEAIYKLPGLYGIIYDLAASDYFIQQELVEWDYIYANFVENRPID